jgi:hypothetical protein
MRAEAVSDLRDGQQRGPGERRSIATRWSPASSGGGRPGPVSAEVPVRSLVHASLAVGSRPSDVVPQVLLASLTRGQRAFDGSPRAGGERTDERST